MEDRTPLRHRAARLRLATAAVAALGLSALLPSLANAADTCGNVAYRSGAGALLGDCRAWELVSTDLNHASLNNHAGHAVADGNTMSYTAVDAPEHAASASVFNVVRATRDPNKGWSGVSLTPRITTPTTGYFANTTFGFSADLKNTLEASDQPLSGGNEPTGQNLFLGNPTDGYTLLTTAGSPFFPGPDIYLGSELVWATPDLGQAFMHSATQQVPNDPLPSFNTVGWSREDGLYLVGILPNGTPAPNGASLAWDGNRGLLQPASSDGRYVAFTADGVMYLRKGNATTVQVDTSRRTTADPNPAPPVNPVGVTGNGKSVLFTSSSELTNDANTGETGGVSSDAGRDLYSFDIASGDLTDLTADTNPADDATGANVQTVLGATQDGSHIYFTATGVLAAGATTGHTSLYVWHDGQIAFVANADALDANGFYFSSDGQHAVFTSSDQLTSYRNIDPSTGAPHAEVYRATLGGALVCVSCRADGSPPMGDASLPTYTGLSPVKPPRALNDDGSRVFFHSTDAVIRQATSGVQQVFEYSGGRVTPISRPDSTVPATIIDASASGDDVFFTTYDSLVPDPSNGDTAVYDARVGGGIPRATNTRCAEIACQPATTPEPALPTVASIAFLGGGNADETRADSAGTKTVTVSKIKTINGTSGSLKVKVPGAGRVSLSGVGLQAKRSSLSKAQTLTIKLQLTSSATKTLKRKRSYKTKAKVTFTGQDGHTSSASLSITFKVKGR